MTWLVAHSMDVPAHAKQILFETTPEFWRRPPGWPHSTWLKNIWWSDLLWDGAAAG